SLRSLFDAHAVVNVHPFGLGNREETRELSILKRMSQLSSIKQEVPGSERVTIRIRRGDDVQSELSLPLPDVIKIDVEGFEPEVMAGLMNVIARRQPIIFFEYQFLTDKEIRGLIPRGYEILLMLDDGRVTADFARRTLGTD